MTGSFNTNNTYKLHKQAALTQAYHTIPSESIVTHASEALRCVDAHCIGIAVVTTQCTLVNASIQRNESRNKIQGIEK